MSYAYISYHPVSHLTRSVANDLQKILPRNWVQINDLRDGREPQSQDKHIAENDIKHACCVVVVCTNRLRTSPWYEMDIKLAQRFNKPIIPLLTDGKAENTLPLDLQTKATLARLIDRTQEKLFDQATERLAEEIKKEIERQQAPDQSPPVSNYQSQRSQSYQESSGERSQGYQVPSVERSQYYQGPSDERSQSYQEAPTKVAGGFGHEPAPVVVQPPAPPVAPPAPPPLTEQRDIEESIIIDVEEQTAPPPLARPPLMRVNRQALEQAQEHARSDLSREIGGICIGYQRVDEQTGELTIEMTDTFRSQHTDMHMASITFTPDTWSHANNVLDEKYAPDGKVIIGWYHSHPNFGVFMSGHDRFFQDNFFSADYHIALVIDPVRKDYGFFVWVKKGREKELYRLKEKEITFDSRAARR